jgi:4a-hydroxytetrahydrobiopterin dehydratase
VPGTPPISEEETRVLLREVDEQWDIKEGKRLVRKFKFPDFKQAFEFAAAIAELAESEGHHPDLEIGWGRVVVSSTTHVAGGLTRNDFILAAKIDQLTFS